MSEPSDCGYDDVNEDGSIGGFDAEFVDADGVRTRYYDVGEGEPLLLVHGGSWGSASSANTWTTNLAGLGDRFRVLAPDRIATGMTANPPTEAEYVYGAELDHLSAFVDELGLDSVHLVGQSRGAGLAGQFAVECPERVETLVLVNNRALSPDVGDFGFRRFLLQRGQPDDPDSPTFFEDRFRYFHRGMSYTADHIGDDLVRTAAYMRSLPKSERANATLSGETLRRLRRSKADAMRDVRRRIRDGALAVPTLLYWGRNDPTAPLDQGRALFELLSRQNPKVRMYTVDRAGHMPYREYPAEFDATVSSFVETWAGTSRSLSEVRPEAYRTFFESDT